MHSKACSRILANQKLIQSKESIGYEENLLDRNQNRVRSGVNEHQMGNFQNIIMLPATPAKPGHHQFPQSLPPSNARLVIHHRPTLARPSIDRVILFGSSSPNSVANVLISSVSISSCNATLRTFSVATMIAHTAEQTPLGLSSPPPPFAICRQSGDQMRFRPRLIQTLTGILQLRILWLRIADIRATPQ